MIPGIRFSVLLRPIRPPGDKSSVAGILVIRRLDPDWNVPLAELKMINRALPSSALSARVHDDCRIREYLSLRHRPRRMHRPRSCYAPFRSDGAPSGCRNAWSGCRWRSNGSAKDRGLVGSNQKARRMNSSTLPQARSGLNIRENELSTLTRHPHQYGVDRPMNVDDTCCKLKSVYPQINGD